MVVVEMVEFHKIKITVLRRFAPSEVLDPSPVTPIDDLDKCELFRDGQEFVVENMKMPEGFCSSAWHSIYCNVRILLFGGDIPWYKEKLYIVILVTLILIIIGYFHPFLKPFFDAFLDYLILIWWALLLGFLIGGIIDYFIPREYIRKYLSRRASRTIWSKYRTLPEVPYWLSMWLST